MRLQRESGNEAIGRVWEQGYRENLGMRLLDMQEQIHLDMLPTDLILSRESLGIRLQGEP